MESLKDKINEVAMERTICYGPHPVYRIIFKKDGGAIYEGKDHVKKIGRYTGYVDSVEFERLVELMDKLDFLGLEDNNENLNPSNPGVITTITYGGESKSIKNYTETAPVEIWAVEKVIDEMIEDIYWEKEE